tara:strand:+ start:524 stop:883 length:360 start_codon:yes stop_codon:yes gene_type:complete
MKYFLITDHIQSGMHEYDNIVLVRTKMTIHQLDSDYKKWKQNYLAWLFGVITFHDYDNNWESDSRIVTVSNYIEIPEKDFEVLNKYNKSYSLEQIIKDGEEEFSVFFFLDFNGEYKRIL